MAEEQKVVCVWGEQVGTEDDNWPCLNLAVGIVAVKDGRRVIPLAVCHTHRLALIQETAPL